MNIKPTILRDDFLARFYAARDKVSCASYAIQNEINVLKGQIEFMERRMALLDDAASRATNALIIAHHLVPIITHSVIEKCRRRHARKEARRERNNHAKR